MRMVKWYIFIFFLFMLIFLFIDVSWIKAKEDLEGMVDITSCPSNTSALSTSTEKSRKQSSENKSTVVQQTFNEYLLWVRNRLSARDTKINMVLFMISMCLSTIMVLILWSENCNAIERWWLKYSQGIAEQLEKASWIRLPLNSVLKLRS